MANTPFLAAIAVLLYRVLRELWRLYAKNVGTSWQSRGLER